MQSIPAFRNCSLLITIEQYLFIWILLKIVVSLIFSMLVMCMLQLASNGKLVCVILLAFLGSEYLLNYYIKDRSIFSYFKYINIFCFSDGKKLLQNYVNLNLFGKPINIYAVGIIIGIIGFTVFLFGMIWLYPKQRQIGKWEGFSFVEILRKKFYRKRYCTKLWLFEVKKYFIQEKMFLVIIAVIGMGVIFYQGYQTERYGDNKEAVYVSYMQKLEGTWNTEKENYYQSQVRYFEDLKEELEELRDGTSDLKGEENYQRKAVITAILDTQQEGFYDISNQYEHMQRIHEKYGVDLEFPNEYACRKLFYTKDDDVKLFAWLMVWVVVSIESLFWVEYKKNLYQLVHSTPKGRAELFRIKCAIGVGVGVFSFIATYLPKILSVYKQYGSKSLFCHLKLMPQFQCCGSDMTMIKAFVCMMITRFLLLLAAVMVASMISVWCKNYLRAIIFTAVVLFVPCVFVSQNELLRIVEFILHPQNWNIMIGIWGVLFISIFLLYRKAKKIFGK